ncbi:helix-turn-helix domain-containing protein [Streptomyces sp. 2A115]|uniref:helix-turn-helix domain-containing protein n=1 Tax=Streptomyces sp. 2A115 TaxID=3457439 RepID=UPI003FD54995
MRQLTIGLRELRESAGLSLARLAVRTPYSKSSWARYLNGEKPVPYDAVEALCRVAGERPERLLALWELADAEWSGRGRRRTTGEERGRRGAAARYRRGPLLVTGAGVVAVLCAAVLLLPDKPAEPAGQAVAPATYAPGCTGETCDGRDPADMGCGGQFMVTSAAERTLAGGQRVELRYGEVCRAVWARASQLRVGDRVELSRAGARAKDVRAVNEGDTEGYLATPMTAADDGPRGARVCLVPADGERVCFGV